MVDFASVGRIAGGYMMSGLFWMIIVIVVCIGGGLLMMYYQKRKKLKYNVLELVRFGNGKIGINSYKAGVFGVKSTLFGLYDYGIEKVVKTEDNRIIQKANTGLLHDVLSRKGFICLRSPNNPKILVPISNVKFLNGELLMDIAPQDYTDSAIRIFREAVDETKGTWEKLLPYIAIGLCVVLTLVNVVVNMQMTNHTTDNVGKLLIEGCSNKLNTQPSNAP